jgi:hypothetical protein
MYNAVMSRGDEKAKWWRIGIRDSLLATGTFAASLSLMRYASSLTEIIVGLIMLAGSIGAIAGCLRLSGRYRFVRGFLIGIALLVPAIASIATAFVVYVVFVTSF